MQGSLSGARNFIVIKAACSSDLVRWTGQNRLLSLRVVCSSQIFVQYKPSNHSTGASGIGELLANTLAVRNVSVVVLDINPIVTENCMFAKTPLRRLISFAMQTISLTINAMFPSGKKLKLSQRK